MLHSIRNAGLGLAFLYMTVLGFDNITYGFCLSQCVTEWILGVLVGVSAIFGVVGSLSFPCFRKRLGLAKTGLVGMIMLVTTLSLCVVSIWLDGSPFDPNYLTGRKSQNSTQKYNFATENNLSGDNGSQITDISTFYSEGSQECSNSDFLSICVFLAGIISARFGLWISDLTITQILQANIIRRQINYTIFS